jgi:hypothetical protein
VSELTEMKDPLALLRAARDAGLREPDLKALSARVRAEEAREIELEGGRSARRRVVALASVAAAVALLVALIAALGLRAPDRANQAVASNSRQHGSLPGAAPGWRLVSDISLSWRVQPGVSFQPGFSLTCPSTSTCYADDIEGVGTPGVEAGVEVTHDGGDTWQRSVLPVELSDATRLVCVNAETCAVLGIDSSGSATLLKTSDGGQSWTPSRGPSELTSTSGVAELSCMTTASCVVVASDPSGQTGAAAAYSTDNGASTWTESDLPSDFVPGALQCVSLSTCVTVGFRQSPEGSPASPPGVALYSSNGGLTWTTSSLPPTPGVLTRLTCADASDCTASFFNKPSTRSVLVSGDGGRSWTEAKSSPRAFITGLSCPTASECWASGIPLPSGSRQPVPVLKGEGIISSTANGGDTWQNTEVPGRIGAVVDISCPTQARCYAIGIKQPPRASYTVNSTTPAAPSRPLIAVLLAYGS